MNGRVVLPLLMALALVFSACNGGAEPAATPTPVTPVEAVASPTPDIEEPAPITEPDVVTPTDNVTSPVVVGDTQEPRGVIRASDLMGYHVENAAGENLGNMEDAVVELQQGCIDYLLLSFGGILGLGANQYLISWDAVQIDPMEQRLLLNIDQAALENAPLFDMNNLPDFTTADWDAPYRTYWATVPVAPQPVTPTETVTPEEELASTEEITGTETVTPEEEMAPTEEITGTETVTPEEELAPTEEITGTETVTPEEEGALTDTAATTSGRWDPTQPCLAYEARMPMMDAAGATGEGITVATPRVILLSDLLGYDIYNSAGEELGELEDIMVDWRNDRLAYGVLTFGGFLGLGERWFVIPLDELTLDPLQQRLIFDAPRETLENAPGFDPNALPDTEDPDWDTPIRDFWRTN